MTKGAVAKFREEIRRPLCRDCADHDGTCPNDGLPCDPRAPLTKAHIPAMLRLFRLPVETAGSRMPWATDWPLDKLCVEAANRIEQLEALSEAPGAPARLGVGE